MSADWPSALLLLAAVGLPLLAASGLSVESWRNAVMRATPVAAVPALLLALAGFGIKAGALSLHFWLPLAHPAGPVPDSAALRGAMLKAGLLDWIRLH